MIRRKLSYPTIDRSSLCLFEASSRILLSTFFTSPTGSRRKISSGSTELQSVSPSGTSCSAFARFRRAYADAPGVPVFPGVEVAEWDATEDLRWFK